MKPKCLFALYAFEPFENANSNVAKPIVDAMSEFYDIDLVTLNKDNTAPSFERIRNINVHRYKRKNTLFEIIQNLYYLDLTKKRSLVITILLSIGKLVSLFLHLFPFFQHPEYRMMKGLLRKNHYSVVFSTCESFLSCWHLRTLKRKNYFNSLFVVLFMDPFCFYHKNIGCRNFLKKENSVYDASDLIFVTNEIYNENKHNLFEKYLYKTIPYSFYNFSPYFESFEWDQFRTNKINCVYAGSFVDDAVRSPVRFLEIVDGLPDNIDFHIICNNLSPQKMEEYKRVIRINKNVFWHSNIPFPVCKRILCNSDFLISLSNKVANQTPSKIFDYMSTGLPIINFYSLENDCSNPYLSDYPLRLLINENDPNDYSRKKICDFLNDSLGKRLNSNAFKTLVEKYDSKRMIDNLLFNIKKNSELTNKNEE